MILSLSNHEKTLIDKLSDLQIYEQEKHLRKEERELNEKLLQLREENKDTCFGFLSELVEPIKEKYEKPIYIGLKSKLNLFVIDSRETAKRVDKYLHEKGIQLDLLILQNIPNPLDPMEMKNK